MIGGGNPSHQSVPPISSEEPQEIEEESIEESKTSDEITNDDSDVYNTEITETMEEVLPENLGFTKEQPKEEFIEIPTATENPIFETPIHSQKSPIKITLPKLNFKLPKLKTNFFNFYFSRCTNSNFSSYLFFQS